MTQTNEVTGFFGTAVNAGYKSFDDGIINLNDAGNILAPVLKGEAAIKGIGEVIPELAKATPAEKEDSVAGFAAELGPTVNDDDRADLTAVVGGIQAAISMGARKAAAQREQEILSQLAVKLNAQPQLAATDHEGWTADKLRMLLAD